MKVFCAAFLEFQFSFVIFWRKNIGTKVACKMLMKLTTGVNFINMLMHSFYDRKCSVDQILQISPTMLHPMLISLLVQNLLIER